MLELPLAGRIAVYSFLDAVDVASLLAGARSSAADADCAWRTLVRRDFPAEAECGADYRRALEADATVDGIHLAVHVDGKRRVRWVRRGNVDNKLEVTTTLTNTGDCEAEVTDLHYGGDLEVNGAPLVQVLHKRMRRPPRREDLQALWLGPGETLEESYSLWMTGRGDECQFNQSWAAQMPASLPVQRVVAKVQRPVGLRSRPLLIELASFDAIHVGDLPWGPRNRMWDLLEDQDVRALLCSCSLERRFGREAMDAVLHREGEKNRRRGEEKLGLRVRGWLAEECAVLEISNETNEAVALPIYERQAARCLAVCLEPSGEQVVGPGSGEYAPGPTEMMPEQDVLPKLSKRTYRIHLSWSETSNFTVLTTLRRAVPESRRWIEALSPPVTDPVSDPRVLFMAMGDRHVIVPVGADHSVWASVGGCMLKLGSVSAPATATVTTMTGPDAAGEARCPTVPARSGPAGRTRSRCSVS